MSSIAIVGGGPRGLSLIERIGSGLPCVGLYEPVRVVLFEPGVPGAGRIWDPTQPRELLMNTRFGEVTIFADETVPTALPRRTGPTLQEWARVITDDAPWRPEWAWLSRPTATDMAADLREAAARLSALDFPPRAVYGAYLVWAHRAVVAALPGGVTFEHVARRVVDLRGDGDHTQIMDDAGQSTTADAVVLAVGWLDAEHDRPDSAQWVGPDNPLDQALDAIHPGESALLTGLGMSLFDNLARLTEGRGGRFDDDGDRLAYVPSGREPRLLIGSRSGRPYWPKPELTAPPVPQGRPRLEAVLARGGRLDFERDIWPALITDAAAEYLRVLRVQDADAVLPGADVEAALDALESSGPDAVQGLGRFAARVLRDPGQGLAAEALGGQLPPTGADGGWLREQYERMVHEARRGDASPVLRALTSLSGARARLAGPLSEGRIAAASLAGGYRRYHELAPRLGGGPPLRRVRELLALVDAGIVQLLGPGIRVEPSTHDFSVRDAAGGGGNVAHVVESWMHRPTITRTADPLLRALRDRGIATAYTASDETGTAPSEAVRVSSDGRLVSESGTASRTVRSVGIPSDEQIGHSVISPVPRTGSRFLRETDAAASGVLRDLTETGADA